MNHEMKFRYREMIYRPDYYHFHADDRTEWFPNGVFNYNVSRVVADLAEYELDPDGKMRHLQDVRKAEVQVQDILDWFGHSENLQDEHIEAADLNRPVILAEVSPDSYNLIDGHHRLEKARRQGQKTLPAYFLPAQAAVLYLGSEKEYCSYVNYWNSKVEDRQDDDWLHCNIPGVAAPYVKRNLQPDHIRKQMMECVNDCRLVELYSCSGEWFSLFRLNGKLFCGEAEAHASVKCASPFEITEDMIANAVRYFPDWNTKTADLKNQKEQKKLIRKIIRHADLVMACVRVFSEY